MTSTADCSVVLFFGELCSIWGNELVSNDWWELHGATKARDLYQQQLSDGQDLSAMPPHNTMPSHFFFEHCFLTDVLRWLYSSLGMVGSFPFCYLKDIMLCFVMEKVSMQWQLLKNNKKRQKALKTFPNSFFQKLEPLLSVAVLSITFGP